jgi:hypothetical protein
MDRSLRTSELDGLRLIALGRIPRCRDCPRFRTLVVVRSRGGCLPATLPSVPAGCTHQVCAPLVARRMAPGPGVARSPGKVVGLD